MVLTRVLSLQAWLRLSGVCCLANVASNKAIELHGTLTKEILNPQAPVWKQSFRIQCNADASEWCIETVTTPPRSAFNQGPDTIVSRSMVPTAAGDVLVEFIEISSL